MVSHALPFWRSSDIMNLRHGSNELDSSSPTERSSPVILSAAKDLAADRDRPFPFAALRAAAHTRRRDTV